MSISALIPMVCWQEHSHPIKTRALPKSYYSYLAEYLKVAIRYSPHKKLIPVIIRDSILEQMEEEDPWGNCLTQLHLENQPLNGSSGSSSLSD